MNDEDTVRTAFPKGRPNAAQFNQEKKKYEEYNKEANSQSKRLHDLNNLKQHAIFYHFCVLREGSVHFY
jgi:hypothetical protein